MNRWALALAFIAFSGSFILLCRRSRDAYGEISPSFETCLTYPARYEGREVRGYPFKVVEVRDGDFTIEERGVRIRVAPSSAGLAIGDHVGLVSTFRGGALDASVVTRISHYPIRRGAMFGVSILAMTFVLFLFLKSFRVSAADGVVKSA